MGAGALATGWVISVTVPGAILLGAGMSATSVLQSRMVDGVSDATRGTGFGLFRTLNQERALWWACEASVFATLVVLHALGA